MRVNDFERNSEAVVLDISKLPWDAPKIGRLATVLQVHIYICEMVEARSVSSKNAYNPRVMPPVV